MHLFQLDRCMECGTDISSHIRELRDQIKGMDDCSITAVANYPGFINSNLVVLRTGLCRSCRDGSNGAKWKSCSSCSNYSTIPRTTECIWCRDPHLRPQDRLLLTPNLQSLTYEDVLPPFPFPVVCLVNEDRYYQMSRGHTYTILRQDGGSSDYVVQGVQGVCSITRFCLPPTVAKSATTTSTEEVPEWKVWRDVNRPADHCPCGIPKVNCIYH